MTLSFNHYNFGFDVESPLIFNSATVCHADANLTVEDVEYLYGNDDLNYTIFRGTLVLLSTDGS